MEAHLTDNLLPLKVPVLQVTHQVFPSSPRKASLTTEQLLSKIYSTINASQNQNATRVNKSSVSNEETVETVKLKCNCKKSKCLKLYCECFGRGQFCDGCLCEDCENKEEFKDKRAQAIDQVMDRMPLTFANRKSETRTCNCKKTGCIKKYCECFKAGGKCGQECKCVNCLNY